MTGGLAKRQPPATAGTMLISSPSPVAESIPSRKRTSSPLTYTLTKLRRSPFSSHRRSLMPGNWLSHGVDDLPERRAVGIHLVLTVSYAAERGRYPHRNGHVCRTSENLQ